MLQNLNEPNIQSLYMKSLMLDNLDTINNSSEDTMYVGYNLAPEIRIGSNTTPIYINNMLINESGRFGPFGYTGPTGATGPNGLMGSIGPTGATGIIGLTGITGINGVTGVTGAIGHIGQSGPNGFNYGYFSGSTGSGTLPSGFTGGTGPFVTYLSQTINKTGNYYFNFDGTWETAATTGFNTLTYQISSPAGTPLDNSTRLSTTFPSPSGLEVLKTSAIFNINSVPTTVVTEVQYNTTATSNKRFYIQNGAFRAQQI